MNVSVRPLIGNTALVEIQGPADISTSSAIKAALFALIAEGYRDVVISLEQVDTLDSSGLGVFVMVLKKLREAGGDMQILCSRPSVREIFSGTGLNKVFQIIKDENEIDEILLTAEFPCLKCPLFVGIPNCPVVKSFVYGGAPCKPGPHLQWLSRSFKKIFQDASLKN